MVFLLRDQSVHSCPRVNINYGTKDVFTVRFSHISASVIFSRYMLFTTHEDGQRNRSLWKYLKVSFMNASINIFRWFHRSTNVQFSQYRYVKLTWHGSGMMKLSFVRQITKANHRNYLF